MKRTPKDTDDLETFRKNGYCLVDKTYLIERILRMDDAKVFLFARPRRFGKTMALNLLDAFLDREFKGRAYIDQDSPADGEVDLRTTIGRGGCLWGSPPTEEGPARNVHIG